MREDMRSYVCLWPTEFSTGSDEANALFAWIAAFGSINWLDTDQGSQFTFPLVRLNHI